MTYLKQFIFVIFFQIFLILSFNSVASEKNFKKTSITFENYNELSNCLNFSYDFDKYKDNLKNCYSSNGIIISENSLNKIQSEKTKIFDKIPLDNQLASIGNSYTIGITPETNIALKKYIELLPSHIFGLDKEIRNLIKNNILSGAAGTDLITTSYNAFKPILLAQASVGASAGSSGTAAGASAASASSAVGATTTAAAGASATVASGAVAAGAVGATVASTAVLSTLAVAAAGSTVKAKKDDKKCAAGHVTLSSSATTIDENSSDNITLTAQISSPACSSVTIALSTSGTASEGTDYTNIEDIVIPNNGSVGTTTFTPTDDTTLEAHETAVIDISSVSGVSASENGTQQVTLTITDNETPPTVTLSSSASTIAENDSGTITLTATLSTPTYENVTVALSSTGTALEGTDYGNVADITISAGSTTGTVVFDPTDDTIYEINETAIFDISSVSGGRASESGSQQVSLTITSEENAPTLTLSSSASSIAENASGTITLTATLSGATYENVVATLAFSGTASSSTDYQVLTSIIIAAGETTGTVRLLPTAEDVFEADETVIVDIDSVSGGGATESGTQQETITITNDDSAPTLTLTSSASSISEDAGSSLTLTGTLTNATNADVTVSLSVSGTSTAGSDYTALSNITISAGETTGTTSFTPINDNTFEGDETAIIDVNSVSGGSASENGTQQLTITILEDDAGPSLSINDVTTSDESAGNATFTITTDQVFGSNMTVQYATSDGTATAGSDYTSTSGTATITAGASTTTFNVPILSDTIDETNETVTITLSNPTLAKISDATGILTITDDDAAPSLSISDVTVSESAGTATMTVSLSAASGKDISVAYATSDGTATAGSDYTSTSGSLSITAGNSNGTFTIPITSDAIDENNETITVTISSPTNASISDATASLTITDDDAIPSLSIADATSSDESAATTSLTVSLSAASAKTISVGYSTSDGTATAGSDYTATSGTLTFSAGETSKTIDVAVLADSTFEGDETVTVTISSPSNASISDATATLTISDDDAGPALSVNDVSVTEANTTATFTISMTPASSSTVTVNYATSNVTAIAGTDYTSASGSLTFNPGDTSKTVAITIAADSLDEVNETATFTLSNAVNASISDTTGTLTINDDDNEPSLSINDASVAESVGTATLTVTLSTASGKDVSFSYATSNGSATAGSDYTSASGNYTISAGDTTQTISVAITDDSSVESTSVETINVSISNASNATISDATGVISVTDNDGLNAGTPKTYDASNETVFTSDLEFQQIEFGDPSKSTNNSPYETINLHKALSYEHDNGSKVMGDGKVIAIFDNGFQVNGLGYSGTTHTEFDGKNIYVYDSLYFTSYNSSSNYHGTNVASVAAGSFGTGATMGVAPEANLHLFDFNIKPGSTSWPEWFGTGTDDGRTDGAVVQNNSWGYDDSQTTNEEKTAYVASVAINDYVSYMNSNSLTPGQTLSAFASLDQDSNGANDILYTGTSSQWDTYANALNNFQSQGVIVWALTNNFNFDDADVSAALPELYTNLDDAWITVANVEVTGTSSPSYSLQSAPCGSTADYCMAADGTNILMAGGNDYSVGGFTYETASGTSFAAPQVSGAVAILSNHFPNQTPEQWTDRLLASANNNLGFTQTGTVNFGNGIVHGYSNQAGHGILDLYAALQPITSTSYARSIYSGSSNLNGSRHNLKDSGLVTNRSIGDGLENSLLGLNNYFYDALGGGFKYNMSNHVVSSSESQKTIDLLKEMGDLDNSLTENFSSNNKSNFAGSTFDVTLDNNDQRIITTVGQAPPPIQSFFEVGSSFSNLYSKFEAPYLSNKEGGAGITLINNYGNERYMLSFNQPIEYGLDGKKKGVQTSTLFSYDNDLSEIINVGFIAGQISQNDSFLGLEGYEAFTLDGADTDTSFIGTKFKVFPNETTKITAIATAGSSNMNRPGYGLVRSANDVTSSSIGLAVDKTNIFGKDKIAFSIVQPNRINNGNLNVLSNNLSDSEGNLTYNNNNLSIAPSGRQLDISMSYSKDISDKLVLTSKLIGTNQLNHIKTQNDVLTGFVGLKYGGLKLGTSASNYQDSFNARAEYSMKF